MTAPADTYTVASGLPIYGGRAAPPASAPAGGAFVGDFDATPTEAELSDSPFSAYWYPKVTGKPLLVELHGSSGQNYTTGLHYTAPVSGRMAYAEFTNFEYSMVPAGDDTKGRYVKMRPVDEYGKYPGGNKRESFFAGFNHMGSNDFILITARRLDAMMRWAWANLANKFDLTRSSISGGSMGADACFTYGIRRPQWFAAVYSDRGRWRYAGQTGTGVFVPTWDQNVVTLSGDAVPNIAPEDGGGKFIDYQNGIAWVSDTSHRLPWIGWAMGTADTNYSMTDHAAALAALRARKSGHCFLWNAGGHTTGPGLDRIFASYPPGTFEIGRSYPYFFEHSLDKDPLVDAEGSVNEGLKFRNVTDTAGTWSCEITSILGACTVKVEPCNPVNFPAGAPAQRVTISAANTWVTVSF